MSDQETDTLELELTRSERLRRRVYIVTMLLVSAALFCAWLIRTPTDLHRAVVGPVFILMILTITFLLWRERMPLERVELLMIVVVCAMPLSRQIWLYSLAAATGEQWLRLLGNTYWATSGVLVLVFAMADRRRGLITGAAIVLVSILIAIVGVGAGVRDLPSGAIPYVMGSLLFLTLFLALMSAATVMRDQWHSAISRAEVYSHWALTDKLTGLANRRAGTNILERWCAAADRHDGTMSVILGDLDGFKRINDTAGHAVGDAVLCGVAAILRSTTRASDAVVRWGGEEFLVIVGHSDLEGARLLAERCRRAIAAAPIAGEEITMTFGVAELECGDTQESLLGRADANLYIGKEASRNRVEASANPLAEVETGI